MIRLHKKYPFIILLSLTALWFFAQQFLLINITPSMPRGLYIKQHGDIKRGNIVSFCLTEPYQTLGLQRLYIEKGKICNGADALIKKVIAVPHDTVVLRDEFIKVNNVIYPYKTHHRDSIGRQLFIYPRGVYKDVAGYWVIGTNDPKSWDSRYWGEIQKSQILTKLKSIVVF